MKIASNLLGSLKTVVSSVGEAVIFVFSLPSRTISYIGKVIHELRLVEWLNWKEVAKYTFAVVFLTILVGVLIISFDGVFVFIRNIIFNIG